MSSLLHELNLNCIFFFLAQEVEEEKDAAAVAVANLAQDFSRIAVSKKQ